MKLSYQNSSGCPVCKRIHTPHCAAPTPDAGPMTTDDAAALSMLDDELDRMLVGSSITKHAHREFMQKIAQAIRDAVAAAWQVCPVSEGEHEWVAASVTYAVPPFVTEMWCGDCGIKYSAVEAAARTAAREGSGE